MLSQTPVRDDDRQTPPIQRYLRWLLASMSMYASLRVTSRFGLRTVPADATLARALPGLMPVRPPLVLVWALAAMATGIGFMVAGFPANALAHRSDTA